MLKLLLILLLSVPPAGAEVFELSAEVRLVLGAHGELGVPVEREGALGWTLPGEEDPSIWLELDRPRSTIPRHTIYPRELSQRYGATAKVVRSHWRGFEIDLIDQPLREQANLIARVPARPYGVLVRLSAPIRERQRLPALMDDVLAGLDARTYWMRSVFGADLPTSGGYLAFLLGLLLVGGLLSLMTLPALLERLKPLALAVLAIGALIAVSFIPAGAWIETSMLVLLVQLWLFLAFVGGVLEAAGVDASILSRRVYGLPRR